METDAVDSHSNLWVIFTGTRERERERGGEGGGEGGGSGPEQQDNHLRQRDNHLPASLPFHWSGITTGTESKLQLWSLQTASTGD